MRFALITVLVFVVTWTIAYFLFIRHLLMQYKITAGVIERMEAAEGDAWARLKIWLEGKKTLAIAFLTSGFAAARAATDHAVSTVGSLQPTDIATLQDKSLWSAFFDDIWTLHIIAALGLLTAFLTLKGKVMAAQITPNV